MIDILEKIAAHKRIEVKNQKSVIPLQEIINQSFPKKNIISAKKTIQNDSYGIITEFKRKSPSKPDIHLNADFQEVIPGYAKNGAAAISILTDEEFFGGNLNFLKECSGLNLPLLRKDFIIDAYQIYESRINGADFILLIAAILTENQIKDFTDLAHQLGIEVLLEFHAGEEFSKLYERVDLVGINNRNLRTFDVDIQQSLKQRDKLGADFICVSESGIHCVEDYLMLKKHGFDGFLMGEYFMKHQNPALALSKFIEEIQQHEN